MTPASPIISVLMPVYNAQRYVSQAVQSILAQRFTKFEFIIIDDGSTDGSLEILQKYARLDQRIRLYSRPNTGYTWALNEMLGYAHGDFIARMDADDVAFPERFGRQVSYLEKHPECAVVGCAMIAMDPDGWPIERWAGLLHHQDIDAYNMTGVGSGIPHPGAMIRTDAMRRAKGYRVELEPAEDFDLWLRIAEFALLANLPDTLMRYRMHLRSVSVTRSAQQGQKVIQAISEARCRRGLPPIPSKKIVRDPLTARELMLSWVYSAFWSGNYPTGVKYAWRLFALRPFWPPTVANLIRVAVGAVVKSAIARARSAYALGLGVRGRP